MALQVSYPVRTEEGILMLSVSVGKHGLLCIKGSLLGTGSYSSVFLGMSAADGLLMAVKQIPLSRASETNDRDSVSRSSALTRELEALRDLQHERLVQVWDWGLDEDVLNVFIEYVPGGGISDLIRKYGALEDALCRNFTRQILQGLAYLHGKDIVHANLKSSNVLVANGGIKISGVGMDNIRRAISSMPFFSHPPKSANREDFPVKKTKIRLTSFRTTVSAGWLLKYLLRARSP